MSDQLQPMPEDWERALAVVAHPDDIEFGAAAAVAAWTEAGKAVHYLLLTRGEAGIDGVEPAEAARLREQEQRASAALVGVKDVEFLDHPDGVLEYGVALRRDITAALRKHRPDLVIGFNHHELTISGKWNSPDHRNAGRALIDAVGDAGNRWVFPDAGPSPWHVRYVAIAQSPHPTHAVDVTDTLEAGIASLEAHRSYLAGLNPPITDVRGPMTGFARQVGKRFGDRPAIALELYAR
ncbi:PIG-L deacetylase family protein [Saccharothrix coeruleofusca]|uniref:GlcNAc-PI de-N-acetylase n=1 Tax=Saccharothrix coeruleofusca TaxID=33919 RepID=A0A918EIC7_9PSEU|nr:PIG-L deacetylase family protein [Saccharothrix coeruleofusca]MBP2336627.1 LmbE family N-acetylglucosaminyl deacetylase [Saccharothrix coeruleofusca]GGP51635.1 GlcNAc-PI de-N-acetylase [Saccharothrix coeruleofusca]GGP84960.1 GlcNAc-PI de-N-acetylase [Saccharothrix coeruleofusca]